MVDKTIRKPLTVYKASAGSGKTFTLATEYIRLLVENPLLLHTEHEKGFSPVWMIWCWCRWLGFLNTFHVGFTVAYFRLRSIEKNLDVHVFCNGNLLDRGPTKKKPSNIVFDRKKLIGMPEKEEEK